ncbi:MAG TPA: MoaD/ThiS family protein [Agriterribacter sp.]|nr:MoaD/ThiS family protein [Agriterribacter sp.]
MKINIIAFGKLTDIVGKDSFALEGITDTNQLKALILQTHPALADMSYLVAVNKKVVSENTALSEGTEVALLPPFSGG